MDRTSDASAKAQRWVHEAIEQVREELPFPLLGLDCDNGSEFINMHLFRYCAEHAITFTRSRPYRKNDNCYVEQKNWPVVRQQSATPATTPRPSSRPCASSTGCSGST